MRRTVNPNWIKLLWNRLEEIAHERERPLELRMQWPDNADVWFEVRVSNGKPRAVIDDRVIALLDRIDKDELLRRLVQENQRASWPTNTAAIRAARGNTIGLTLATSNIAAPLAGRTTLNVDIYQSLKIDKQSLRPLLPAEVMSKVNAETRLLTLRRLGELLGIPVFKEDVPSDGRKQTAAVASRDGAPDEDDSDEDDALEDDADDESSPVWRFGSVTGTLGWTAADFPRLRKPDDAGKR